MGDALVATAEERALRGRSGIYDVTVAAATGPSSPSSEAAATR